MHLSGVRPSVRLSVCPNTAPRNFAAMAPDGRRYRSIAARRTAQQRGGRTRALPRVSVRSS